MKKYSILLLLGVTIHLASCKLNDDQPEPDSQCYVQSVTLGTVKRAIHTTTADGKDTIIHTTFSGNLFPMVVNQRTLSIENHDSLLQGADLSAVLLSVKFTGAALGWRQASDTEGEWTAYKASDSLDLRTPIELFTLANDGHSFRIYTLKVNIHQQDGEAMNWTHVGTAMNALNGLTQAQAFSAGQDLMLLARKGTGISRLSADRTALPLAWTTDPTDLPFSTDVNTLQQLDGKYYVSTTEGGVYRSQDAITWEPAAAPRAGLQLVASSDQYLYGLEGESLLRSTDGLHWEEETTEKGHPLPFKDVRALLTTQTNGTKRIVLIGQAASLTESAIVWYKAWTKEENEDQAEWACIAPSPELLYPCPLRANPLLFEYDGKILLMGGSGRQGSQDLESMDFMHWTRDYGIAWKKSNLTWPAELTGAQGTIAAVVDEDEYIWIIANTEVWRGRLNKLGFVRQ